MSIAYFILVHRYPNQFKRLFRAIYDPGNHYLIHIDKRAGRGLYKELQNFLAKFPNAHLLASHNVVWGGYSMVNAELRSMKKLLKLSKKWDFLVNLSGQDFPLKSQSFIKAFLKLNMEKDFMLVANQKKMRPETLNRIENYFVEGSNDFLGVPVKRSYLIGVIPFIGGQWKILSRNCCEFLCSNGEVARFERYYKNTLIPDESFFQTVLMNTNYTKTIINDDKRAIIWIPDIRHKPNSRNRIGADTKALIASGKIKLRPKTFTIKDLPFLQKSKALFARKFDETVDSQILDILESQLKDIQPTQSSDFFKNIPISPVYDSPMTLLAKLAI
jgi:hypothetical protein